LHIPDTGIRIAVNVNASDMCLERRWPESYFVELIARLLKQHSDWIFLFVGSKDDVPYVDHVLSLFSEDQRSRLFNLAGLGDIKDFIAQVQTCSLLITNDSGPMHVAQLVDVPTVSFFGPAPPTLFHPLGPKNRVLYAGVWCSPCLNYYTLVGPICHGNNICMKEISVDQAFDAVEEHFARFNTLVPPVR
jgi:ADP-heptose:LPS heptosyltransferase